MQEKLFHIPPIKLPRPNSDSIKMIDIATEMFPDINGWLGDDRVTAEDIESDFSACFSMRDIEMMDGYKMARELEVTCSYEPDSQFVRIMDDVFATYNRVLGNKIKKWVIDCEIEPSYDLGTNVYFKTSSFSKDSGEIVGFYKEEAKYVIQTEEYKTKNPDKAGKPLGLLVKYEDVEKI